MTREKFEEIFKEGKTDFVKHEKLGESTLAGLNIIAKYLPNSGIECADHDIIYASDIDTLIKAGITETDVITLRELNWIIQDDYLASYV